MLSALIELAGYGALVTAGWLVTPVLGLAVLGVALWVIAQAADGIRIPIPRLRRPRVRLPKVRVAVPRVRFPSAKRPVGPRDDS